jgi:hypothetical protein
MPDTLESSLIRLLAEAAQAAPAQPPGLLHDVDIRFRRRRRRAYATAAGVAVLAVVAGSALTTGVISGPPGRAPVEPGVPAGEPGRQGPIAELWPQAYHSLPATLDNGRKYHAELMIDDRRLLATAVAGFEKVDELWTIDVDTRESRRIAVLPTPKPETALYPSHFTVGSGHVVWWTAHTRDGEQLTEVWKVPVSGGTPALVTTARVGPMGTYGLAGDRLTVAGDAVYWSRSWQDGDVDYAVWRAPLAGGAATMLPGTDGFHIIAWPWIGSPGSPNGAPSGRTGTVVYRTLRNLQTGAVRDAAPAKPGELWMCAVSWCVADGPQSLVVRQRDGSQQRELPGRADIRVTAPMPLLDRFVLVPTTDNTVEYGLYDLRTGALGTFRIEPDRDDEGLQGVGVDDPADRLVVWPIEDGRSYAVLDLAAIR